MVAKEEFFKFKMEDAIFGQAVIGSPGSGKTTYCQAAYEFFEKNERKVCYINLDPANENVPQLKNAIDIMDLITVSDVIEHKSLGPNGALLFCFEYLWENIKWLNEKLANLESETYLLIDFPGQIELYTGDKNIKKILHVFSEWNINLAAINLIDGNTCLDPCNNISALLVSLCLMIYLELPHINCYTKFDILPEENSLFNPDFNCPDYYTLSENVKKFFYSKKFEALSKELCDMLEDYDYLDFFPLSILDPIKVRDLIFKADRTNGHIYSKFCLDAYNKVLEEKAEAIAETD